jgi:hypothetical protein
MSGEDQRNTLITELAGRTRNDVRFYQGLDDAQLAGTGALLVYLRGTKSRTDAQIKTMTADDMRNTVIVEIHEQTHRSDLQGLENVQLALTALGSRELRNLAGAPEYLRPGQRTLVFRVGQSLTHATSKSYSDVPFIGTFTGRGIDCTHGTKITATSDGVGDAFKAVVGWGQVEGDGHPGSSSDQCVAWVHQLMLNFDVNKFVSIPRKTFNKAVLAYREQEASGCMAMVYTQGGYLMDSLPCWTNGDGRRDPKPNGCLALSVADEDWIHNPPSNRPVGRMDFPVQKIGPSSWDVSQLFQSRHLPALGHVPTGTGYLLVGDALDIGNLTADDNTRCTSVISDVRLEVTYTIPPVQEEYDIPAPR